MTELDEVRHLLTLATFPGLQQLLRDYESTLSKMDIVPETTTPQTEAAASVAPISEVAAAPKVANLPLPPAPVPVFGGRDQIYVPITDFAWDQGGYNSETVTVYVELDNVGTVKDQVNCSFTASSFDLIVMPSPLP
jgi:hypothetical protein